MDNNKKLCLLRTLVVAFAAIALGACGGGGETPDQPAAATVNIGVAPTSMVIGATATLTWSSTNATTCTASGAWTGAQATSGTMSAAPAMAGSHTYTLTCTNSSGASTSASATLAVTQPPAPTASLSFSTSALIEGAAATLTWSSTNATACTASDAWTGTQATSGTLSVAPVTAGSYTYTLTCTNSVGVSTSGVDPVSWTPHRWIWRSSRWLELPRFRGQVSVLVL